MAELAGAEPEVLERVDVRGARRAAFEASLRVLRQDERNVALPGLFATYLGIAALLALDHTLRLTGLWMLWLVPMGLLQYRVTLSGHEAVHKTLCYPLWLNELCGVVGQSLVGVNFASYRVQHLDHHRATSLEEDPDGHIYGGIVRAPRGARRWVVYTLGTLVEIAVKVVQKGVGSIGTSRARKAEVRTVDRSRLHTVYVLATQTALLFGCAWIHGAWYGYFVLWIAPLFGVAVFLNRSRILVEHGLALLDGGNELQRGIPTVDIVPHPIERWVFSPFLFNYHCAHHLYLTVPHYNLPRLHALLVEHGVSGHHVLPGGYVEAIRRAMSA